MKTRKGKQPDAASADNANSGNAEVNSASLSQISMSNTVTEIKAALKAAGISFPGKNILKAELFKLLQNGGKDESQSNQDTSGISKASKRASPKVPIVDEQATLEKRRPVRSAKKSKSETEDVGMDVEKMDNDISTTAKRSRKRGVSPVIENAVKPAAVPAKRSRAVMSEQQYIPAPAPARATSRARRSATESEPPTKSIHEAEVSISRPVRATVTKKLAKGQEEEAKKTTPKNNRVVVAKQPAATAETSRPRVRSNSRKAEPKQEPEREPEPESELESESKLDDDEVEEDKEEDEETEEEETEQEAIIRRMQRDGFSADDAILLLSGEDEDVEEDPQETSSADEEEEEGDSSDDDDAVYENARSPSERWGEDPSRDQEARKVSDHNAAYGNARGAESTSIASSSSKRITAEKGDFNFVNHRAAPEHADIPEEEDESAARKKPKRVESPPLSNSNAAPEFMLAKKLGSGKKLSEEEYANALALLDKCRPDSAPSPAAAAWNVLAVSSNNKETSQSYQMVADTHNSHSAGASNVDRRVSFGGNWNSRESFGAGVSVASPKWGAQFAMLPAANQSIPAFTLPPSSTPAVGTQGTFAARSSPGVTMQSASLIAPISSASKSSSALQPQANATLSQTALSSIATSPWAANAPLGRQSFGGQVSQPTVLPKPAAYTPSFKRTAPRFADDNAVASGPLDVLSSGSSSISIVQRRRQMRKSESGMSSSAVARRILETLTDLSTPMEQARAQPVAAGSSIRWNAQPESLSDFTAPAAQNKEKEIIMQQAAVAKIAAKVDNQLDHRGKLSNTTLAPTAAPTLATSLSTDTSLQAKITTQPKQSFTISAPAVAPVFAPSKPATSSLAPHPDFPFAATVPVPGVALGADNAASKIQHSFERPTSQPIKTRKDAIKAITGTATDALKRSKEAVASTASEDDHDVAATRGGFNASAAAVSSETNASTGGIDPNSPWAAFLASTDISCPMCLASNPADTVECGTCESYIKCPHCKHKNTSRQEKVCDGCKKPFKGAPAFGQFGNAKPVTAPTPAAAGISSANPTGFTFGTANPTTKPPVAAPAPASVSGFVFGASAPAPAPASGGFVFGAASKPVTAAPAAAGFTFGAPAGTAAAPVSAPASSAAPFTFGATKPAEAAPAPAAAPASAAFTFGATKPAVPAPATFGGATFGAAAFGATSAISSTPAAAGAPFTFGAQAAGPSAAAAAPFALGSATSTVNASNSNTGTFTFGAATSKPALIAPFGATASLSATALPAKPGQRTGSTMGLESPGSASMDMGYGSGNDSNMSGSSMFGSSMPGMAANKFSIPPPALSTGFSSLGGAVPAAPFQFGSSSHTSSSNLVGVGATTPAMFGAAPAFGAGPGIAGFGSVPNAASFGGGLSNGPSPTPLNGGFGSTASFGSLADDAGFSMGSSTAGKPRRKVRAKGIGGA